MKFFSHLRGPFAMTVRSAIVIGGISSCLGPAGPLSAEALSAETPSAETSSAITKALAQAGDNRAEIQRALDSVPEAERESMIFLVENMPVRDLTKLKADYLLKNVRLAHAAWAQSPWKASVPKEVFHNSILPYACINETREQWREDFFKRFKPLVKDAKTSGQAGVILNQKVFPILKVRYSRQRRRADQSPSESIETGTASCTGLSVLLIDACRSVGVPARFVGTPLWADSSGNHSWVEVWDDGWHFTGAAEPSGDHLDRAWFVGRASKAQREHPLHAIYAVSYRRTPQPFPMVWNRGINDVYAVNVTDRYTIYRKDPQPGFARVMFRAMDRPDGNRCRASLKIKDSDDKVVYQGETNDERFDGNDHLTVELRHDAQYTIEASNDDGSQTTKLEVALETPLQTFYFSRENGSDRSAGRNSPSPVDQLKSYLSKPRSERADLKEQKFATTPLTKTQIIAARDLLWNDHVERIRKDRAKEMKDRTLKIGNLQMRFDYKVFGDKPKEGRSLYISMHGGGGAPPRVNDRQWENQKRLYSPAEGVYLAPRAPTDTWNLWHQSHIDGFFDRLIENLVVFEDVDPDRVYLMGYSAGGDGVYQLAPRMADRFGAAAMMAGHPNETSPLGLRNLAFTIHMGGQDKAYSRNKTAEKWKQQLAELQKNDPKGYVHLVHIHPEFGHWMNRKDAVAVPWMAKHRRNPFPKRVVWKQDDVRHSRFYWLSVDPTSQPPGAEIEAAVEGQQIKLQADGTPRVSVLLNDRVLDLDREIVVLVEDKQAFKGRVQRTIGVLDKALRQRGDPKSIYCCELSVSVPSP